MAQPSTQPQTPTTTGPTTADLVGRFTAGFAERALAGHAVVSGLGVWLLLALVAREAPGPARVVLEQALGTDADDAAARAGRLLDDAHPQVAQAVAVWVRDALATPGFASWADGLPAAVARGTVPTQDEADAWTVEQTQGLVTTFPVSLRPLSDPRPTAVVLTSALATQIRWAVPFDMAEEVLGGAFAAATQVLSSKPEHTVHLVDTAAAGRVAVHTTWSDGLHVTSVVGEPGRSAADVHRGALQAVGAEPVDLFDVPLGAGHAWTLDETAKQMVSSVDRMTTAHAYLPAWDATTRTDLAAEPWFPAAAAAVGTWVTTPAVPEAVQCAVASYDRTGFSAAAVTGFATRMKAGFRFDNRREVRVRHLQVRFDRPYAVVATADNPGDWTGVPVFSAWVADPR